jgi:hypothetical protein
MRLLRQDAALRLLLSLSKGRLARRGAAHTAFDRLGSNGREKARAGFDRDWRRVDGLNPNVE